MLSFEKRLIENEMRLLPPPPILRHLLHMRFICIRVRVCVCLRCRFFVLFQDIKMHDICRLIYDKRAMTASVLQHTEFFVLQHTATQWRISKVWHICRLMWDKKVMISHVLQHTQSFVLQHTKRSLYLSLSVNVSCTAVLQCVTTHRAFCLATCCNTVCLCVAPHRALGVAARCNTVCLCVAAHCNTVICSTEFFLLQHRNGCNTGMASWLSCLPRNPLVSQHTAKLWWMLEVYDIRGQTDKRLYY